MSPTAPVLSSLQEIEKDWIDYNNHLNMGFYTVLFDRAVDEVYEAFGFGPAYIAARNCTTFSAEFHVRYLREIKLGDRVRVAFRLVDFDEKRLHTFQEMYHEDGWLAATGEGLTLHVDLSGPKVTGMPPEILSNVSAMAAQHASLPMPDGVGRSIGIRRQA